MSVPGVVESTLDGETVAAEVALGGEDVLYITPTRTLIYRAEGLLSDETVEEYPHEAERLTVKEGRRKTRFSLEYPLDGTKEFTLPSNSAERALHPVLAGIMNAGGVTDPGETVVKTYRFSELTLVITSERLVKHIGEVVWDEDYEEFHYDDVTDLTFEEGSVATQIVLEVDGRQQRIKAPKEHAREVRERLTQALYGYYDVNSMDELRAAVAPDETLDEDADATSNVDFGEGVDPLEANPPAPDDEDLTDEAADAAASSTDRDAVGGASATARNEAVDQADAQTASNTGSADATQQSAAATEASTSQQSKAAETAQADASEERGESSESEESSFDFEDAGFEPAESDEPASDHDDLAAEVAELRAVVEQQNERLDEQRRVIEQLVEELSRGR
ncbi:hypothetical protein SAMN06269185_2966 [Natronoarchaeum philippinense]|uniref:DUF7115 domain-containing protein n=1 Tax=Natronoarchaeum philippinense TaxID=558529 RepID=A0A285P6C2_NATPI|nr:hypothetical protein [Natronoarchaeum philippinense]SNZ17285.1 hypothetical protein SAMN06269185_2966 [Natronoarchaeum philippinense]